MRLILQHLQNYFCLTCHSIILKYIKNISNKLAINGKLSGHTIVVSGYVEKNGTVSGTPFDLILSDSKILATDIPLVTKRILGTSANLIHERTFLENGKVTINTYPQSTGDNNIIGYWIVVLRKV